MNHDYAHCADFTQKCPMNCFRAQLVRDLKLNSYLYRGMPISYIHFRQAGMCQIDEETDKEADDATTL